VGTLGAVVADPGVDRLDRLGAGVVLGGPDLLVLERAEEALDDAVLLGRAIIVGRERTPSVRSSSA